MCKGLVRGLCGVVRALGDKGQKNQFQSISGMPKIVLTSRYISKDIIPNAAIARV